MWYGGPDVIENDVMFMVVICYAVSLLPFAIGLFRLFVLHTLVGNENKLSIKILCKF